MSEENENPGFDGAIATLPERMDEMMKDLSFVPVIAMIIVKNSDEFPNIETYYKCKFKMQELLKVMQSAADVTDKVLNGERHE